MATWSWRASSVSLYGMLAQLLLCGLMLVPGLTLQGAGVAVMLLGGSFGAGYLLFGEPRGPADSIANSGKGFLAALAGLMLLAGWAEAMYVYAAILGIAVFGLVRLCWMLLTMAITGLRDQRGSMLDSVTSSRSA